MSDFEARARKAAEAVRNQIAENAPGHETGIRRAQRSPARVAVPTAVAASVLIGAVIVAFPRGGGGATVLRGDEAFAMAGALKPFDTCDTVLQYFKDQAPEYLIERVGGGRRQFAERTGAEDSAGAAEARNQRRRTRKPTSKRQASMSRTSSRRMGSALSRSRRPACIWSASTTAR